MVGNILKLYEKDTKETQNKLMKTTNLFKEGLVRSFKRISFCGKCPVQKNYFK